MNYNLLNMFDTILNFFDGIAQIVPLSTLMTIMLVLLGTIAAVSILSSSFAIEIKTNRAVNRINSYLDKKPFVNEDNLVEFNKLMKTIPKPMRYQWQQYMLNREDLPGKFLTQDNCIERPFRSSSYEQIVQYTRGLINIFTALFLLLSFASLRLQIALNLSDAIFQGSIIPATFFMFAGFIVIFLRARRKAVISDLYYNFEYMINSLNKAVETIPTFVDYEILFSRKEIKQGIPALQDYLEKRALYEQEQLERAKASAIEHDKYDFAGLDLNSSLVMERAMREAEYYLANRSRLLMEVEQLEGEKDSHSRAYSENTKTLQRKLRDIKESLDRLRESLANVSNKIDSNYIRKQQADEVKKQQALEKELATITNRYNKDISSIDEEIAKRNSEIESQRGYLEKAMNGEFGEFSKKVYDQLNKLIEERSKETIQNLKQEKRGLEEELDTANILMVEKEVLFKEKLEAMNKQEEQLKKKDDEIALKEQFIKGQAARIKELEAGKVIQRYFDANGNEFFYDENSEPYYRDENGNIIYYDAKEEPQEGKKEEKPKTQAKKTTSTSPATKKAAPKEVSANAKDTDDDKAQD